MDGTAPASKVFTLPRLIIADQDPDESKIVKRDNVGGPGKTCWFKEADELTENPEICFGMGVSPESRDYTLQALLQKMDNDLIKKQQSRSGLGRPDRENHIENYLNDKDKEHHATRTVFMVNKNKKDSNKNLVGRTVFYVTVGQMKHSRIFPRSV